MLDAGKRFESIRKSDKSETLNKLFLKNIKVTWIINDLRILKGRRLSFTNICCNDLLLEDNQGFGHAVQRSLIFSHVWLNQVSIQATNIHTQASNIHTKSPPITLIEAISTLKLVCVPCQFKIQNNDGLRICFTCCRNECQSMISNYFW